MVPSGWVTIEVSVSSKSSSGAPNSAASKAAWTLMASSSAYLSLNSLYSASTYARSLANS
jgi:hypothetical protein